MPKLSIAELVAAVLLVSFVVAIACVYHAVKFIGRQIFNSTKIA